MGLAYRALCCFARVSAGPPEGPKVIERTLHARSGPAGHTSGARLTSFETTGIPQELILEGTYDRIQSGSAAGQHFKARDEQASKERLGRRLTEMNLQ